ncbi:hypothetical protein Q5O89_24825 [Peribacillus frigoritolerans]|nr:hypothetical protein [Peribacillus frigoritolerans]
MKVQLKYTVFLVLTTIFVILYLSNHKQTEETIIFFPSIPHSILNMLPPI